MLLLPNHLTNILHLIVHIFLFLHSTYIVTDAYNLDTQKALIKQGTKGSYFGYSIAQHATYDQQNVNSSFRAHVIVGAPKDELFRSSFLSRATKPGAIYRCDFSLSQSCHLLDIDSLAHSTTTTTTNNGSPSSLSNPLASSIDSGMLGPSGNLVVDSSPVNSQPRNQLAASNMDPEVQRDNQWLGVTVKSQGPNGYAMACAHRYVLKGPTHRWGQGICYSLTRNLTLHKTWQPCYDRPVNRAHEEYGYCQAGTSSDISDTADIVMGAPGVYTWRGTVFSNSIRFSPRDDRTWYMAPVQDDETKVNKYSYLGMSVITGKFFNNQQYYVSGAPRSNEIGQVLFMTKLVTSRGRRSDSTFRTDQILDGEQMGSAFGYSLAKMDFNGDGRLDLIVSAPFYFSKTEGGAVYLYSNDKKDRVLPAGKLTGKPESRFGLAIANCGDLNRDKFEDLAVGAPYDPHGGSVYIYLGSASGIKTSPSQVIKASAVSNNLQTFGYSLAGGMDMDMNGYPDLVVGSYADDQIFVLRGRPIIEISTRIEGDLSRIDPNKTTCDNERNQLPCFKFNTCFELDPSAIGEYSDTMKLKYRIEAETFTGQKYSRVRFQESENSDTPQIVEKEIIIKDYPRGIKLKRCNTQRVYIKDRSDIQTPIQFKLTYSLVPPNTPSTTVVSSNRYSSLSTSNQLISSFSLLSSSSSGSSTSYTSSVASSSSMNNVPPPDPPTGIDPPFPILNQEEAQRTFAAYFLKDCGSNDICESYLDVDGSLQLPKETLGINEPGYSYDKQINVTIRVANNNEPAYEAKLFVTHPSNVIYSGFKASKQVAMIDCSPVEKNLVKCNLGNPMNKGTTKLMMVFNTQNQAGQFDFNLMVNTTSQNSKDAKTSYDLSGSIRKKTEIIIPARQPPSYPEAPTHETPSFWVIFFSILLGLILFAALWYWLYVNGFLDRKRVQYTTAETEDRFN